MSHVLCLRISRWTDKRVGCVVVNVGGRHHFEIVIQEAEFKISSSGRTGYMICRVQSQRKTWGSLVKTSVGISRLQQQSGVPEA